MTIETCNICGEKVEFSSPNDSPQSCPACFNPWVPMRDTLPTNNTDTVQITKANTVSSLILICQRSGKHITISPEATTVLGREAHGSDILIQPQISRKHCLIEWNKQTGFSITDMNSTHGTYLGISRIDCSKEPKQQLNDGEILFLGREVYTIRIETATDQSCKPRGTNQQIATSTPSSEHHQLEEEVLTPKQSENTLCECEDCNQSFDLTDEMRNAPYCPVCGCFNRSWLNQ